jgi:hypothetical protein
MMMIYFTVARDYVGVCAARALPVRFFVCVCVGGSGGVMHIYISLQLCKMTDARASHINA